MVNLAASYGQAEKKKKEVRKKVYFCGNEKLL